MELRRTFRGSNRTGRVALATLLMFVLLLATACSASHALHQSLHRESGASDHFCLVCFLVKGHVAAAPVALVLAVLILFWFGSVGWAGVPAYCCFDYRLSPSRAPPSS